MKAVLVVDDEDSVRVLLKRLLASAGHEAVCVAGSDEALGALAAEPGRFGLLITDVFLVGMGGLMLAQRALQAVPALRVLFISGDPEQFGGSLDSLGPVLAKPFTRGDFLAGVAAALAP